MIECQATNFKPSFLRKLISHTHYGIKTADGPCHVNTNERVLRAINACKDGSASRVYLRRPKNQNILDHQNGGDTLYFCAGGRYKDEQALCMIDIDNHRAGTLQEALRFAQHLRDSYFPNLYYEVSTNGRGVHGYLIVDKRGCEATVLNKSYKQLQRWIKNVLAQGDWNVEGVEIKGMAPVLTWDAHKVTSVKAGTLAKIPRGDFTRTTVVKFGDLLNLPAPEQEKQAVKKAIAQNELDVSSFSEEAITEDDLSHMPYYRRVAEHMLQGELIPCKGRVKVLADDCAIASLVFLHCFMHPNKDGSFPFMRIYNLWQALYERGQVSRAPDTKRITAIRNYFSSKGLLEWEDNIYQPGYWKEGKYVQGKACKWTITQAFVSLLHEEEKNTLLGTQFTYNPNYLRPVKKLPVCKQREEQQWLYRAMFEHEMVLAA